VGSLLLLAISLGVEFDAREELSPFPSSSPVYQSIQPSPVPSAVPTGHLDQLYADLPYHTHKSLQNDSTPQWKAWDWLSYHQNITNLPEWRKKQLFALATFFFAFEGENWNPVIQDRWRDDTKEECQWFTSGFGLLWDGTYLEDFVLEDWGVSSLESCNNLGEFTALDLQGLQLGGFAPFIPPEITLLTSLTFIRLYLNDI
jgi:hypothetical protein